MGLIVDNFAGGGGASTGIEQALGRAIDIAINHDAEAIRMHEANHPGTLHIRNNIWQVDPLEVTGGQPVDLAWFSPDCKHFSKAKGGKPREKSIRDLAWVVVLWAKRARPALILLENVEEFRSWGPLDEQGGIIKERAGETFDKWCRELRKLGYKLQFRELRACDYGAPTIRKRFFMVARCDGLPIVWPEPTHGKPDSPDVLSGKLKPWRTAAEIIDWSLPCPSIFERKKPLADKTLRRIAHGIVKFVLNNPQPFIVPIFIMAAFRVARVGFAMLTRSAYLEGGDRHRRLWSQFPPSFVLQFSERVVMLEQRLIRAGDVDPFSEQPDRRARSATAYVWLVWLKGQSDTRMRWIGPCRDRLERPGDYPDYGIEHLPPPADGLFGDAAR
jgi:site-specific DNA-cytosine methylase